MEDIYIMNSKAKFKKNLTRLVCLVLAGVMLLGSFAYFTMGEIPTPVHSEGLTEEGMKKEVLLQGTIDCFFEDKDGRLVLIDYKTDRVDSFGAKARAEEYRIQIECYREALEMIEKRKVDECYIYFLSCNETVRM
jgi:ATP-dependent helicase/nuclease subunit A